VSSNLTALVAALEAIDNKEHELTLRESEKHLRRAVRKFTLEQNEGLPSSRKISVFATDEVVTRHINANLSADDPRDWMFGAAREVATFVDYALTASGKAIHQDLLPVGHPNSQNPKLEGFTASGVRAAVARWHSDDARVDDSVRSVVFAAFSSEPGTVENQFALARMQAVTAGLIPSELIVKPLVAAFGVGNPFAGNNSSMARSARAKMQRRDRKGRFAEMGGGARLFAILDGIVESITGKFAGNPENSNDMEIEIKGHPTIPDGIYTAPAARMEGIRAVLGENALKNLSGRKGAFGPAQRKLAVPMADLLATRKDAPTGWNANGDGSFTSADGYNVTPDGNGGWDIKDDSGATIGNAPDWANVQKMAAQNDEKSGKAPKPKARLKKKDAKVAEPAGFNQGERGGDEFSRTVAEEGSAVQEAQAALEEIKSKYPTDPAPIVERLSTQSQYFGDGRGSSGAGTVQPEYSPGDIQETGKWRGSVSLGGSPETQEGFDKREDAAKWVADKLVEHSKSGKSFDGVPVPKFKDTGDLLGELQSAKSPEDRRAAIAKIQSDLLTQLQGDYLPTSMENREARKKLDAFLTSAGRAIDRDEDTTRRQGVNLEDGGFDQGERAGNKIEKEYLSEDGEGFNQGERIEQTPKNILEQAQAFFEDQNKSNGDLMNPDGFYEKFVLYQLNSEPGKVFANTEFVMDSADVDGVYVSVHYANGAWHVESGHTLDNGNSTLSKPYGPYKTLEEAFERANDPDVMFEAESDREDQIDSDVDNALANEDPDELQELMNNEVYSRHADDLREAFDKASDKEYRAAEVEDAISSGDRGAIENFLGDGNYEDYQDQLQEALDEINLLSDEDEEGFDQGTRDTGISDAEMARRQGEDHPGEFRTPDDAVEEARKALESIKDGDGKYISEATKKFVAGKPDLEWSMDISGDDAASLRMFYVNRTGKWYVGSQYDGDEPGVLDGEKLGEFDTPQEALAAIVDAGNNEDFLYDVAQKADANRQSREDYYSDEVDQAIENRDLDTLYALRYDDEYSSQEERIRDAIDELESENDGFSQGERDGFTRIPGPKNQTVEEVQSALMQSIAKQTGKPLEEIVNNPDFQNSTNRIAKTNLGRTQGEYDNIARELAKDAGIDFPGASEGFVRVPGRTPMPIGLPEHKFFGQDMQGDYVSPDGRIEIEGNLLDVSDDDNRRPYQEMYTVKVDGKRVGDVSRNKGETEAQFKQRAADLAQAGIDNPNYAADERAKRDADAAARKERFNSPEEVAKRAEDKRIRDEKAAAKEAARKAADTDGLLDRVDEFAKNVFDDKSTSYSDERGGDMELNVNPTEDYDGRPVIDWTLLDDQGEIIAEGRANESFDEKDVAADIRDGINDYLDKKNASDAGFNQGERTTMPESERKAADAAASKSKYTWENADEQGEPAWRVQAEGSRRGEAYVQIERDPSDGKWAIIEYSEFAQNRGGNGQGGYDSPEEAFADAEQYMSSYMDRAIDRLPSNSTTKGEPKSYSGLGSYGEGSVDVSWDEEEQNWRVQADLFGLDRNGDNAQYSEDQSFDTLEEAQAFADEQADYIDGTPETDIFTEQEQNRAAGFDQGERDGAMAGPATDAQYDYVKNVLEKQGSKLPADLRDAMDDILTNRNATKSDIGKVIGEMNKHIDPNVPSDRQINSIRRGLVSKGLPADEVADIMKRLPTMKKDEASDLITRLKGMEDSNGWKDVSPSLIKKNSENLDMKYTPAADGTWDVAPVGPDGAELSKPANYKTLEEAETAADGINLADLPGQDDVEGFAQGPRDYDWDAWAAGYGFTKESPDGIYSKTAPDGSTIAAVKESGNAWSVQRFSAGSDPVVDQPMERLGMYRNADLAWAAAGSFTDSSFDEEAARAADRPQINIDHASNSANWDGDKYVSPDGRLEIEYIFDADGPQDYGDPVVDVSYVEASYDGKPFDQDVLDEIQYAMRDEAGWGNYYASKKDKDQGLKGVMDYVQKAIDNNWFEGRYTPPKDDGFNQGSRTSPGFLEEDPNVLEFKSPDQKAWDDYKVGNLNYTDANGNMSTIQSGISKDENGVESRSWRATYSNPANRNGTGTSTSQSFENPEAAEKWLRKQIADGNKEQNKEKSGGFSAKQMEPATSAQYDLIQEHLDEREFDATTSQAITEALANRNLTKAQMSALIGQGQAAPFKPGVDPTKPSDRLVNSLTSKLLTKDIDDAERQDILDRIPGMKRDEMESLNNKLRSKKDIPGTAGFAQGEREGDEEIPGSYRTPEEMDAYFGDVNNGPVAGRVDDLAARLDAAKAENPEMRTFQYENGDELRGDFAESNRGVTGISSMFEAFNRAGSLNSLADDLESSLYGGPYNGKDTKLISDLRKASADLVAEQKSQSPMEAAQYDENGDAFAGGIDADLYDLGDEINSHREMYFESDEDYVWDNLTRDGQYGDTRTGGAEGRISSKTNENGKYEAIFETPEGGVERTEHDSKDDAATALGAKIAQYNSAKAEVFKSGPGRSASGLDLEQEAKDADANGTGAAFVERVRAMADALEQSRGDRSTARALRAYADRAEKNLGSFDAPTEGEPGFFQGNRDSGPVTDREILDTVGDDLDRIHDALDMGYSPDEIGSDNSDLLKKMEDLGATDEQIDAAYAKRKKMVEYMQAVFNNYTSDDMSKFDSRRSTTKAAVRDAYAELQRRVKSSEDRNSGSFFQGERTATPSPKMGEPATDAQYDYLKELADSKEGISPDLATAIQDALSSKNLTKSQVGAFLGQLRAMENKVGVDPTKPTPRQVQRAKDLANSLGLSPAEKRALGLNRLTSMSSDEIQKLIDNLKRRGGDQGGSGGVRPKAPSGDKPGGGSVGQVPGKLLVQTPRSKFYESQRTDMPEFVDRVQKNLDKYAAEDPKIAKAVESFKKKYPEGINSMIDIARDPKSTQAEIDRVAKDAADLAAALDASPLKDRPVADGAPNIYRADTHVLNSFAKYYLGERTPELNQKDMEKVAKKHSEGNTPDAKFSATYNPNLEEYRSSQQGVDSAIGYVSLDALQDMAGNEIRSDYVVDAIAKDLKDGVGFKEPIILIYDPKTGRSFVTEGNHRVQAARKAGVKYVPVRVVNLQNAPGDVSKMNDLGKGLGRRPAPDGLEEWPADIQPKDIFPAEDLLPEASEGFNQGQRGSSSLEALRSQLSGKTTDQLDGGEWDWPTAEGFDQKKREGGPKRHRVLEALAIASTIMSLFDKKPSARKGKENIDTIGAFSNDLRRIKEDMGVAIEKFKNPKKGTDKFDAILDFAKSIGDAVTAYNRAKARWDRNNPRKPKAGKPGDNAGRTPRPELGQPRRELPPRGGLRLTDEERLRLINIDDVPKLPTGGLKWPPSKEEQELFDKYVQDPKFNPLEPQYRPLVEQQMSLLGETMTITSVPPLELPGTPPDLRLKDGTPIWFITPDMKKKLAAMRQEQADSSRPQRMGTGEIGDEFYAGFAQAPSGSDSPKDVAAVTKSNTDLEAELLSDLKARVAAASGRENEWTPNYKSTKGATRDDDMVTENNAPINPASDHVYSAGNMYALAAAAQERGYSDRRWMTVGQAAKMGAQVRQGEQGVRILAPTSRTLSDGTKIIEMKPTWVFNAEQMDNIGPDDSPKNSGMTAGEAVDFLLMRFADAESKRRGGDRGMQIREGGSQRPRWTPPGADGSRPEGIRMPDRSLFDSPEAYVQSLMHELTHAVGHRSRMKRKSNVEGLKGDQKQIDIEELTAELGSAILMQRLGVPYDRQKHAEYVKDYMDGGLLSDDDLNMAFRDAQLAADYALGNDVLPPWNNLSTDFTPPATGYRAPSGRSWSPDTKVSSSDGAPAFPAGTPGSEDNPDIITGFAQDKRDGTKSVKDSQSAVDKVTAQILDKLKEGKVPWRKPFTGIAGANMQRNPASKRIYTGFNQQILAIMQAERGYNDPRWMTYNQAQGMGGQVRKGEKGVFILVPMVLKREDAKTGEEKSFVTFKAAAVFNVEQIDGLNLPSIKDESAGKQMTPLDAHEFLTERYKKAMESRTGQPVSITYRDMADSESPHWSPTTDKIVLPSMNQFNTPEDMFDTMAHEMVHSTGHGSRLDRTDLTKDYGNADGVARAKEELIAEIGAATLADMFGIETTLDNSAAYVQSWLQRLQSHPDEVMAASRESQKAVDYILGTELGDWSPLDGYGLGNAVVPKTDEESES
jgi:antirestriction protein ArdC